MLLGRGQRGHSALQSDVCVLCCVLIVCDVAIELCYDGTQWEEIVP